MLAELCEKALALTACCEVVAPPGSGSNFSGRLKSVVGAITASMRARSSGVLCSAVGPAAKAAGPTARSTQAKPAALRSEEHTSELQSLMRISYAVFCLKKKQQKHKKHKHSD